MAINSGPIRHLLHGFSDSKKYRDRARDDLLGLGESPSTGESGARTSWVMDRMLAGYRARA